MPYIHRPEQFSTGITNVSTNDLTVCTKCWQKFLGLPLLQRHVQSICSSVQKSDEDIREIIYAICYKGATTQFVNSSRSEASALPQPTSGSVITDTDPVDTCTIFEQNRGKGSSTPIMIRSALLDPRTQVQQRPKQTHAAPKGVEPVYPRSSSTSLNNKVRQFTLGESSIMLLLAHLQHPVKSLRQTAILHQKRPPSPPFFNA